MERDDVAEALDRGASQEWWRSAQPRDVAELIVLADRADAAGISEGAALRAVLDVRSQELYGPGVEAEDFSEGVIPEPVKNFQRSTLSPELESMRARVGSCHAPSTQGATSSNPEAAYRHTNGPTPHVEANVER